MKLYKLPAIFTLNFVAVIFAVVGFKIAMLVLDGFSPLMFLLATILLAGSFLLFLQGTKRIIIRKEEGILLKTLIDKRVYRFQDIKGFVKVNLPASKNRPNYDKISKIILFLKNSEKITFYSNGMGNNFNKLYFDLKKNIQELHGKKNGEIKSYKETYKRIGIITGLTVSTFGVFLSLFQIKIKLSGAGTADFTSSLGVLLLGLIIIVYYHYFSEGYD